MQVPSCQENSVCDYKGHGMCICPNSNQVGPNCGSMGTIQFDTRDSDLIYDAIEPPIGYTRVETIRIPIRRITTSGHSNIPFHSVNLDDDDDTVDPFLSEFEWNNDPYLDSNSNASVQDGYLTIRVPISNVDGTRSLTEEIRVGMAILSSVRIVRAHISLICIQSLQHQPFEQHRYATQISTFRLTIKLY